jgi:predicted RNA-binding Zn-ribbon protein involved in translation (DUF1610 family)
MGSDDRDKPDKKVDQRTRQTIGTLLRETTCCPDSVAHARKLLADQQPQAERPATTESTEPSHPCPHCGGRMIIIETFARGSTPRHQSTAAIIAIRIDTS